MKCLGESDEVKAICAVLIILASSTVAQTGQEASRPKRGETFELKSGESRQLADENLRVGFEGVTEDSRCPAGVQCVWAGDAVVELTLEKPPTAADRRLLHTNGRFARETEYAGLIVRLVALEPQPREGATIAPGDYRLKLVVDTKK